MIIHSIVPLEVIFKNPEEENYPRPIMVKYLGEYVEVIPTQQVNSGYMISRILSTSPTAYLNPKLQPGAEVRVSEKDLQK